MLHLSTGFLLPAASLGLLLIGALTDLAWRIIPNRIPVLLALLGLVLQALLGTVLAALLGAAIAAAICLLLWRLNIIGGGDAKLLPAVALCVPASQIVPLYMSITFAGAILGLLYLALRMIFRHRHPSATPHAAPLWRRVLRIERWRIGHGGPLPYGVAIAAGATLMIL